MKDVVMATAQLAIPLADVIDSDHDGAPGSGRTGRNQVKGSVDVDDVAAAQLWDLFHVVLDQLFSHFFHDLRKGIFHVRAFVILVENAQQCRSTSSYR